MDRSTAKRKMMKMGFSVSKKGFPYILDAMEIINEEGGEVKFTAVYDIIAKKYKKDRRTVERCIRWAIQSYYETCEIHPYLKADITKEGKYPAKEVVMRLYLIIYKPELLEEEE